MLENDDKTTITTNLSRFSFEVRNVISLLISRMMLNKSSILRHYALFIRQFILCYERVF